MEETTQLAKAFSDINRVKIITLVQRDIDIWRPFRVLCQNR
jgi:hypothetical protein